VNYSRNTSLGQGQETGFAPTVILVLGRKKGKNQMNPIKEREQKGLEIQANEALCKILCHNLCVLIQSSYELGVDTSFWAE